MSTVGLRKGSQSQASIGQNGVGQVTESVVPLAQAAKRTGWARRPIWTLALAAVLLLALKGFWRHAPLHNPAGLLACGESSCPPPEVTTSQVSSHEQGAEASEAIEAPGQEPLLGSPLGGRANDSAAEGTAGWTSGSAGGLSGRATAGGQLAPRRESANGTGSTGSELIVQLATGGLRDEGVTAAGPPGQVLSPESAEAKSVGVKEGEGREGRGLGFREAGRPDEATTVPLQLPDSISDLVDCDIFSGRWVRDQSYPLYSDCLFKEVAYQCRENGRQDSAYENYRWQPNGCRLPRFNASDFLERLRNKRVVFIGDSLARTAFESLVCMLAAGIPNLRPEEVREVSGLPYHQRSTKKQVWFLRYRAFFAFYRAMWLVNPSQNPPPTTPKWVKGIINLNRLDSVFEKFGRGADILILNSGHWYSRGPVNYYGIKYYWFNEGKVEFDISAMDAYRIALRRVRNWLKTRTKPQKPIVYWRGFEPSHFASGDWNTGGHCDGREQPLEDEAELAPWPEAQTIAEEILRPIGVRHLNVTHMTRFRHDGHVSRYWPAGSPQLRRNIQDCTHWCLPGVPDAWNELLYASLLMEGFPP